MLVLLILACISLFKIACNNFVTIIVAEFVFWSLFTFNYNVL